MDETTQFIFVRFYTISCQLFSQFKFVKVSRSGGYLQTARLPHHRPAILDAIYKWNMEKSTFNLCVLLPQTSLVVALQKSHLFFLKVEQVGVKGEMHSMVSRLISEAFLLDVP